MFVTIFVGNNYLFVTSLKNQQSVWWCGVEYVCYLFTFFKYINIYIGHNHIRFLHNYNPI